MTLTDLGLDALRVSSILAVALAVARIVPPRAASLRRLVLATAFGVALALPIAARVATSVAAPALVLPEIVAHPFAEAPSNLAATAKAATATPTATDRTEAPAARASIDAAAAALIVWAVVAAALAARVVLAHARARGVANRADFTLDPLWRTIVDEAGARRGAKIAVAFSDEIDTPAAFGVFAPRVLVPRSSSRWGEARRRAALAHELAHVDAKDGLSRLTAQLVSALHWFDPLAWIAARALSFDQELAADQAAIATGARPSSYAADLLDVARAARRAPLATVAMATRSELERRVRLILAPTSAIAAPRSLSIAAVAALAGSALVLACARPSTNEAAGGGAAIPAATPAARSAPPPRGADAKLQAIVDEEIARLVGETSATRAAVIALDPATGRVLAEAGREGAMPADVAFGQVFVPGSTFKLVAVAAALDAGVVSSTSRFDCAPRSYADARILHDATTHEMLSLAEIVALSSNVGVSRIFDALGEARFVAAARRLHFGEAPPGIANAAAGALPSSIPTGSFEGGALAAGEGATLASPAQIAAAYATVAADGVYHAPTRAGASPGERVVSAEAARATLDLLDGAVNGDNATGARARVEGVRVAGKTGTGDFSRDGDEHIYASFVGIAPREAPRLVLLVSADLRGAAAANASGGTVAAPVFARIVRRAFAP